MFLHLGEDTVVKTDDLIGIFDLDNTTVSKNTRDFLSLAQREDRIINVTDDLPKSFVVCGRKNSESKVYISQISPATLKKRAGVKK